MANKRNKTIKEMNNSRDDVPQQTSLSEEQVWDVLKFAQSVYQYAYGDNALSFARFQDPTAGSYTPFLTNERLSEIGLNPVKLSPEQLKDLFDNPTNNQYQLAGYSEYLKFRDAIAKRTIDYLGNLPSFDYTFSCTNINDISEYNSQEYKDDYFKVKEFLSHFDVRGQFAFMTRRMLTIDAVYAVFRTDGQNYEFQELPNNYCKITGKNLDWGFQFDFDMNWFLRMGLPFDQYPPVFKKMWKRVENDYQEKYNPANKLNKRKGTFSLWAQTSSLPNEGNFVCFKFNSDIYAVTPYLSSMFEDAVSKPFIRALQNDQYIIASQKYLIGLIPLLKEQKSGQVKDALAVSPETMGKFLALLKQGLSNALKISGVPFSDVKEVQFSLPERNMYNEVNGVEAANSGVTSRLIYASDRMTATEVSLSANIDEMIATSVYPILEKWLSSEVNWFTKKYKFKFKLEGSKYTNNRQSRLDTALKLADKGIVMPAKIAAAVGMDIFEMTDLIQQAKVNNFQDLVYLLPNSNTKDMGTSSALSGRPKVDVPSDSEDRNLDRETMD